MTVLQGLAWLLLCQSAGEVLTRLGHLPLPGPVLGMLLLFALLTGLVGALTAKYLFDALGVRSPEVRGFALGTTAHGIGAARAMQVNADAGAYAGMALGLQALLAALLMPLIVSLLLPLLQHFL